MNRAVAPRRSVVLLAALAALAVGRPGVRARGRRRGGQRLRRPGAVRPPGHPGDLRAHPAVRRRARAGQRHHRRGAGPRLLRRALPADRPGRRLAQRPQPGDLHQSRPVRPHVAARRRRRRGRTRVGAGLDRAALRLARPPHALDEREPAAARGRRRPGRSHTVFEWTVPMRHGDTRGGGRRRADLEPPAAGVAGLAALRGAGAPGRRGGPAVPHPPAPGGAAARGRGWRRCGTRRPRPSRPSAWPRTRGRSPRPCCRPGPPSSWRSSASAPHGGGGAR